MDLNDYRVVGNHEGDFDIVYVPTGARVLRTQQVRLNDLLRIANAHHHENRTLP